MYCRALPGVLIAFSAVAASACLPNRDNSFDPDHAPQARLAIRGPVDCIAVDTTASAPAVATRAHGSCLLLDSRASLDPLSGTTGLTYEFSHAGDAGPLAPTGPSPVYLVSSSAMTALPLGPTTFSVRVSNTRGFRADAHADVELVNTPPVADAGTSFTYPAGGFPWAPGGSYRTSFDGSRSADADGDAIVEWCWTLGSAAEACGTSPRSPDLDFPSTRGRILVSLRVRDSLGAYSAPDPTRVEVGAPNLYAQPATVTGLPLGGVVRIDARHARVPTALAWQAPLVERGGPGTPGARLALLDLNAGGVANSIAIEWIGPDATLLSSAPAPTTSGLGAINAGADGILRVIGASYYNGSTYQRDLYSFQVAADVVQPTATNPLVQVPTGSEFAPQLLPINDSLLAADAAHVWYAGQFGPVLRVAAFDGSLAGTLPMAPGSIVAGLATRPATGDVWAIEGQNLVSTTSGEIAILRYRWNNGVEQRKWTLPSADAFGLVWGDGDHLWTSLTGIGVCRIDAAVLEAGPDGPVPAGALDPCIHDDNFVIVGAATPDGGSWWQNSALTTTLEVHPDGRSFSFAGNLEVAGLDDDGNYWSISEDPSYTSSGLGSLVRSSTLEADATLLRSSAVSSQVHYDWWGGGYWTARQTPPELNRYAEDGTLLESIDHFQQPDGSTLPIPPIAVMVSDSTGLWALGAYNPFQPIVYRVDLASGPVAGAPTTHKLLFSAPAGFLLNGFPGSLYAAVKTGTPGFWVEEGVFFSGQPSIGFFDAAGTLTTKYSWPTAAAAIEGGPHFGREVEPDGSVILATLQLPSVGNPVLRLRQIFPDARPVRLFNTITLAAGATLTGMDIVNDGATRVWVATSDGAGRHVSLYPIAGTNAAAIRTYSDTGATILSVSGVSSTDFWLLRDGGSSFGRPDHVTYAGGMFALDSLPDGDGLRVFVHP